MSSSLIAESLLDRRIEVCRRRLEIVRAWLIQKNAASHLGNLICEARADYLAGVGRDVVFVCSCQVDRYTRHDILPSLTEEYGTFERP